MPLTAQKNKFIIPGLSACLVLLAGVVLLFTSFIQKPSGSVEDAKKYYYAGKYAEAVKLLSKLIKKDENNAELYYYRALSYYELRDYMNMQKDRWQFIQRGYTPEPFDWKIDAKEIEKLEDGYTLVQYSITCRNYVKSCLPMVLVNGVVLPVAPLNTQDGSYYSECFLEVRPKDQLDFELRTLSYTITGDTAFFKTVIY